MHRARLHIRRHHNRRVTHLDAHGHADPDADADDNTDSNNDYDSYTDFNAYFYKHTRIHAHADGNDRTRGSHLIQHRQIS
jgi:hypothetical protein